MKLSKLSVNRAAGRGEIEGKAASAAASELGKERVSNPWFNYQKEHDVRGRRWVDGKPERVSDREIATQTRREDFHLPALFSLLTRIVSGVTSRLP